MTGYELSRTWFDWAFENPDKISPNHGILYFFCIEQCNRLGWKEKFGLPASLAMEAIGIKSYNTYKKTLNELIEWGFITMIQKSENQYKSNIIALSNFNKSLDKPLNKSLDKSNANHLHITEQIKDSIDKQETIKQENKKEETLSLFSEDFKKFVDWVNGIGDKIMKLRKPFTEKEYRIIKEEIKKGTYSLEEVKNLLESMQNDKKLLTKYESAYLTFNSWMKIRKERAGTKEPVSESKGKLDVATFAELNKPYQ